MDQSNSPDRPEYLKRSEEGTIGSSSPITPPDNLHNEPPPPLSARAWLTQNGPWFVLFVLGVAYVYRTYGVDVLISSAVALVGLGFVVFIHELGHFLAAKWCDVHVQTFSIGFGPALPGCSFTQGETTYKLALLPLGGYVNMVGEGPEADEDEDYPRSFKNKTVGQRMLIISAGVIMNVIFGALCFVLVYLYFGIERPPAIMWRTEAGSRAWEVGVRPGWKLVELDEKANPWFDEMRVAVALSPGGRPLSFTFQDREGKQHVREIEPFRDANNSMPVIGVSQAFRTRLIPSRYAQYYDAPVKNKSAASFARVIQLHSDDVVLRSSDPKQGGELTPLPTGEGAWNELAQRMIALGSETLLLEVENSTEKGKTRKLEIPAEGFRFGDVIVATTDPATPDQAFNLSPLPIDPNSDPKQPGTDPFELRRRFAALAGKPMVVQVQRESARSEKFSILVPPAYHVTLGLRMKMGKVAVIRQGSPAEKAGLKAGMADGDMIASVRIEADGIQPIVLGANAMDPVRLPFELDRRIRALGSKSKNARVILTVRGPMNHDARKERTLPPMEWDDSFALGEEAPVSPAAPMSIPQLGISYWVESTVVQVEPGSPANQAGIKPGDVIQAMRYRQRGPKLGQTNWSRRYPMASVRGKDKEVYDQWAHYFWFLQQTEYPIVRLEVKRVAEEKPEVLILPASDDGEELGMEAVPDRTWPAIERGLILEPDERLHKARTFVEAVTLGLERTTSFIRQIYMNLSRLFSRRISTNSLGGPIEIGAQAISAAGENFSVFTLFLGMISINLAVVNFLPIPVLDGGHMVFLIYEKLRGKPPSEGIRIAATYLGLAIILSLMIFVFFLDIKRRFL